MIFNILKAEIHLFVTEQQKKTPCCVYVASNNLTTSIIGIYYIYLDFMMRLPVKTQVFSNFVLKIFHNAMSDCDNLFCF